MANGTSEYVCSMDIVYTKIKKLGCGKEKTGNQKCLSNPNSHMKLEKYEKSSHINIIAYLLFIVHIIHLT